MDEFPPISFDIPDDPKVVPVISKVESDGTHAQLNGLSLEDIIVQVCETAGWQVVRQWTCPNPNIYGGKSRIDMYLPELELLIEAKWQASPGSADQKFPYLVANILETYPYQTFVVSEGGGARQYALDWMTKTLAPTEHEHMTLGAFISWVNKKRAQR